MTMRARKIGELAAATGLTVRTLHYYEEIGLLPPPARTAAGHRVYGDRHVERLNIPPGLLTERQALVLKLLYDREMDVAEAAALLKVDAQTVRSTHHKAMLRLREHFRVEA